MTQRAFEFHVEPPREPTLDERAEAFHRAHPEVFALMVTLTREAMARGETRVGGKALWEKMRWELKAGSNTAEYRLNNSHVAPLIRKLQREHPELAHMFQTRRRPSEGRSK